MVEYSNFQKNLDSFIKAKNAPKVRKKVIRAAAAILSILLIFLTSFALYLTSENKAKQDFAHDLRTGNTVRLMKDIVCSDPDQTLDAWSIKSLINYAKKYNFDMNKLINNKNGIFSIVKDGKRYFLIPKYHFEVNSIYPNVKVNGKGTKIYVNGDEYYSLKDDYFSGKLGPFLPGSYEFKAVLSDGTNQSENSAKIDMVGNTPYLIDLHVQAASLKIGCNFPDAKLFINGLDSGKSAEDLQGSDAIPVEQGMKAYLQKEFPWGVIKGNEIQMGSSNQDELSLNPVNEKVKADILQCVNDYTKSYFQAKTSQDISKLTSAREENRKTTDEEIKAMKGNNSTFDSQLLDLTYDLNSLKIDYFYEKYYASISLKITSEDSNGQDFFTIKNCEVIYDNNSQKWLVNDVQDSSLFNDANIKDFQF